MTVSRTVLAAALWAGAVAAAAAAGSAVTCDREKIEPGSARPVALSSDRKQKRKTLDEIKVNLHGRAGEIEVYKPVGDDNLGLRGRGPAGYQDLVRRTIVKFVDAEKRIALPPVKPGVGW